MNASADFVIQNDWVKLNVVYFYNDSMYPVEISAAAFARAYEGGGLIRAKLVDSNFDMLQEPVTVKPKQKAKLVVVFDQEHYFSKGCEIDLICSYRGKSNVYSVYGQ